MELKQYELFRKYQKESTVSRVNIGEDYSIPDGKPDIYRELCRKLETEIEEVQAEKGKIRVKGKLKLWMLYLTERAEKSIDFLEMEFPFEEVLYMEEASGGDYLQIEWSIEELRIIVIHPGKIGIRAVVVLTGALAAVENPKITYGIDELDETFIKAETITAADALSVGKETYRIKEEISLPSNKPNVERILWKSLQLQNADLALQEGKIAVKGEILFFVVYESQENEGEISWIEQVIPFQGNVEVPGITMEMFGLLKAEVTHQAIEVHPDYDGEMRKFSIEMLLEIPLQLYEHKKLRCVTDAYSIEKQMVLKKDKVICEKLRSCSFEVCKISETERIDEKTEVSQILSYQTRFTNVEAKMCENGILWNGTLEVQILFAKDIGDYPLGSTVITIPCSRMIEVPGIRTQDQWKVQEKIERILISLTEHNVIALQGSVRLDYCVMEQCECRSISEIETKAYDEENYKMQPGMKIHFVQPGETLWEIAKANRCTVEELKEISELPGDELSVGQKLLIVKRYSEGVAFMV